MFSEKVEQNGWIFYIIEPGKEIFRGDSLQYLNKRNFRELEYFSDYSTAKIYGLVSKYTVTERLLLLAMDELLNLERLYNECDKKTRIAIENSFGYSPENPVIKRESEIGNDMRIAKYVCSSGLDGYAHESISSETIKDFHPELTVCNPIQKVRLLEKMPYNAAEIERAKQEAQLIEYATEEKEKRRKKPVRQTSEEEEGQREPLAPMRVLFGGFANHISGFITKLF
jgi:hypothetical protein